MKKKAFGMFMALILALSLVSATILTAGATDIEPAVYHADVEEATKIPSVRFTGVVAPTLGKTVGDWYNAIQANIDNGTFQINGKPFQASAYDNIYTYGVELLNSNKEFLDGAASITAGTYYFSMYLFPASGYAFADDASIIACKFVPPPDTNTATLNIMLHPFLQLLYDQLQKQFHLLLLMP